MLDMVLRVTFEKVLLVLHKRSLDEDTLASRIYEQENIENLSGLAQETQTIFKELNVEDCNSTNLNKTD